MRNKINDYLWPSSPLENTIHDSYCCEPSTLIYYRSFCSLYTVAIFIWTCIINYFEDFVGLFRYLTFWGEVLVMLWFNLSFLDYLRVKYTSKHFEFWKWAYVIFEVSFSFEVVIVILFWVMVFPASLSESGDLAGFADTINLHGVHFLFLSIDMIFNDIQFLKPHALIVFVLGLLYLIVDVVVTFTVKPVYPFMTYQSFWTAVSILVAAAIGLMAFGLARLFQLRKQTHRLKRYFKKATVHEIIVDQTTNRGSISTAKDIIIDEAKPGSHELISTKSDSI